MAKKIMIVDDEENLIKLVTYILKKEGFDVIRAKSGQECLDKLKSVKPDLILLDIFMPEMDGRATCARIRRNPKTKDLKVIFLTVARFSESGKNILKEMNALDYITKPFDNEDLVERVKKALK